MIDRDDRAPAATETFDGFGSERFFRMGRGSTGRPRVHVYRGDRARVIVGNFVSIGDGVDFVIGGNHRLDWVTTYPLQEMYDLPDAYEASVWSKGDTRVGHGVTIASGAKIMPGVTIGDGAVVLESSVVTKDVEPYAVVSGNPARLVAHRYDGEVLAALRRIDWDSWSPERIVAAFPRGRSDDMRAVVPAIASRGEEERAARTSRAGISTLLRRVGGLASRREASVPLATGIIDRGRATYGTPSVRANNTSRARATVGSYGSLAKECEIVLGDGEADGVTIGNDVWLGMGVRLLPGVTIADGAVVAAWSIVSEDVAPYAIVAGNPARPIRRRFDSNTIAALLRIRWWDWPEDDVIARWRELCSADLATFIARHDPAPYVSPIDLTSNARAAASGASA